MRSLTFLLLILPLKPLQLKEHINIDENSLSIKFASESYPFSLAPLSSLFKSHHSS